MKTTICLPLCYSTEQPELQYIIFNADYYRLDPNYCFLLHQTVVGYIGGINPKQKNSLLPPQARGRGGAPEALMRSLVSGRTKGRPTRTGVNYPHPSTRVIMGGSRSLSARSRSLRSGHSVYVVVVIVIVVVIT